MNYKIGDILKPIDGSKCNEYGRFEAPAAIRIIDINSIGAYGYVILSKEGTVLSGCSGCFKDDNLTPVTKTLNTLQVGDYIQDEEGDYRRVLAVLNQSDEDAFCVYVMSLYGEKDSEDMSIIDGSWNVFHLKKNNYSIEDPTPEIAENTEDQIAAEKLVLLEELTATIRKAEIHGIEVAAILSMIQDMKKRV